ncbi:MAG: phosphoribosylformylglycinamidine synthase, purS protein [Spirochaetae bacterium HGW-Spirochaetae-6]|nr:MAG: phosphoribosylformylglycinamidine synthase, purS protein [Spirochaetae bacterium HGW-Spirochaetae-6]
MKKYQVVVKLKPNVLDPQGKAVQQAAERMALKGIGSIRMGKYFEIETEDDVTLESIQVLAKKILTNEVIEIFEVF